MAKYNLVEECLQINKINKCNWCLNRTYGYNSCAREDELEDSGKCRAMSIDIVLLPTVLIQILLFMKTAMVLEAQEFLKVYEVLARRSL